jgi:hypothetical protein
MIASDTSSGSFLTDGSSPDLTTPDNQSILQKSSLFQTTNQSGTGLICLSTLRCQPVFEMTVMIPVTVAKMNKTNSPFHEAASHHAIASE